ncbi:flagellar basal-body MS-ring/collar protein FliF [Dongia deserti]|uniref:flagellar basal-body MS-ring/collar protein FliF n=1 Tax=Dongia deserti TaxID=2268030 RepID=UPI000E65E265|nr:flagellar basal-body MS-ring/collar protein FliF [Dongia deserti]
MQTLRNLGATRLVALAAVGFALIAFFTFIVTRLASPGMTLLYSGLDPADSGQIVQRMDTQGIPYELRGDGSQIYVPQDQVARLRLSLASEGIPAGGSIGYEIFDRADALGTTNFVQQINQIRALEGELARTIRSIHQVRSARVHLVMPKRELFSRDRAEPTASVVLALQGGLDKGQVSAIQHLIASAVPGMKSKNVSVIDNNGELLARGADEGGLDTANSEDMRRSYEARLSQAIEQLLAQTLGAGKVRAEVTAELDFNHVTTNKEDFNPDGQVVRSTNSIEETGTTQERQGANSVSVANNTPNPPGQDANGTSGSSSQTGRTEEIVNYEISKTVRTEVKAGGEVKRISAAVLVDGIHQVAADGAKTYQPRSTEELAQIDALVKSAIGFDEKRGDIVNVVNMKFAEPAPLEDSGTTLLGLDKTDLMRLAELVVLAIVAMLVLLLVVRPLLGRILAMPSIAPANIALAGPGDRLALPPGAAAALAIPGPAQTQLPAVPSASEAEAIAAEIDQMIDINQVEGRVRASSIKKISELVDQHPEQAVNLIRQWVYQEQ